VDKYRLGWAGPTPTEHVGLFARLSLLNALKEDTFFLDDLAEMDLDKWKERYPRLTRLPWFMECVDRNLECWETIPEFKGRLERFPVAGGYLSHFTLEKHFSFDVRADEMTMTEATEKMEAAFREWSATAKNDLVAELRQIYESGPSLPPQVSEHHFVWAALHLAGKREDDRGYGLTIEEIAAGGVDPRGVQRAIRRVLDIAE